MNTSAKVFFLAFVFAVSNLQAKSSSDFGRGGWGFLFPDQNSFNNPGQLSLSHATTAEVLYGTQEVTGSSNRLQNFTPSIVHSSGRFAVGAFATRSGTDLTKTQSSTDTAGAAVGFGVGKMFTMGAVYSRNVDDSQTDDGSITGTLTFNPPKGSGPILGVSYGTTLGAATNVSSGQLGMGYAFGKQNTTMEVGVSFADLNNTSNYTGNAYASMGSGNFYLGAGYHYIKTGPSQDHEGLARIGWIIGKSMDISAFATKVFETGTHAYYGASFRANL